MAPLVVKGVLGWVDWPIVVGDVSRMRGTFVRGSLVTECMGCKWDVRVRVADVFLRTQKMVLDLLGLIASLGVFFIDVGPARLGLSIPKAIHLAGSTRSFVSIGFGRPVLISDGHS